MKTILYCDGACLGNPGSGGWGVVMWTPDNQVREFGGSEEGTTNNRMELRAAIEGIRVAPAGDIIVRTDSKYLIEGITKWIHGWKKNGWKTQSGDVKNRDLWEELLATTSRHEGRVTWAHVAGHAGIPGNERADAVAVGCAEDQPLNLYQGSYENYGVDLERVEASEPYYLSVVGGQIYRDSTWKACESRVRGQRGSKYKKVSGPDDEASVLKNWGFSKK